jgi:hypothetical protein
MNRYNDWKNLLSIYNEDLEKTGYSLLIVEPEKGYYNCEIRKDGELVQTYAENYYEDELDDLIIDAQDYIRAVLMREDTERKGGIVVKRAEITSEDIVKSKQVLIDNGIEEDEADSVLQALGYTLIDTELFPYPECKDYMN